MRIDGGPEEGAASPEEVDTETCGQASAADDAACPPDAACPAADAASALGEDGEEALAALARALGHKARVRILRVLLARDRCIVGELAYEVPLAASTVSQHLKILKDAGLIKGEVDGPRRCYCVDRGALARLKALVAEL